jgi:hypothetical protein
VRIEKKERKKEKGKRGRWERDESLHIFRPWKVTPTSASGYAVMPVTHTWLVKDSSFIGFPKGAPYLYTGRAVNITVTGNTYMNSGGKNK